MGVGGKNLGPLVLPPGIDRCGTNPAAVVGQGTNERVLIQERQRLLWTRTMLEQLFAAALKAILRGRRPGKGPDDEDGDDDDPPLVGAPAHGQHQPGWDLTFSAPKSVSVAWAVATDEMSPSDPGLSGPRCPGGHRLFGRSRRPHPSRKRRQDPRAGRLGGGCIEHGSSRARDMQLHTHCLVANVVARRDGTTGTIVSRSLYVHKMAAGAIYRAEFAYQLRTRLGFAIQEQGTWFELQGVPPKLIEAVSKRRQQILDECDKKGVHSPQAAAVAAPVTREAKHHAPRSVLFAEWEKVSRSFGFTSKSVERLRRRPSGPRDRRGLLLRRRDRCAVSARLARRR